MVVVLRVQAKQLDLEQCLAWIPETSLESSWVAGSKRLGGGVNTTSGFTLLLADGENIRLMIETAMTAFRAVAPKVAELVQSGAAAEVDCGLMVAGCGSQSVEFGPELLGVLQRSGVNLVVSAYPCSDEDE